MISKFMWIRQDGRLRGALVAVAAVAALAGCSTYDSLTQRVAQRITPYRITIVQGNFVSREAAAQMRVGMSRAEVRQVLGTPLLTDMFHVNRWDYVFYFKRGSTSVVQQRDFVVYFDADRVTHWTGGEDLPSNLELLAEIDGDRTGKKRAAQAAKAAAAASGSAAASAPAATDAAAASAAAATQPQQTVATPSNEASSANAVSATDPNAQAAEAANRATNTVSVPSGNTTPSVRANTPGVSAPSGALTPGQPQLQFHRPPPPAIQGVPQDNPVGPQPGDTINLPPASSDAPSRNPQLAAPPSSQGTAQ